MPRLDSHALPTVAVALLLVVAGCAGAPPPATDADADEPTATGTGAATPATDDATTTPLPPGDVDFPDGPKERPERPTTLSPATVREYALTYEYRYAYNSLWISRHTEVTLDCEVDEVTERPWGYAAVVTCTGYSNTRPPTNATGSDTPTPGPHADWFTQTWRYRVSENATHRVEGAFE